MTSRELDEQADLLADAVKRGASVRTWLRPFQKRTQKAIVKRALVILKPENEALGYPGM